MNNDRIKIHWYDYAQEGVVDGTDERVKRIDGYDWYFVTDEGRVLSAYFGTSSFVYDALKEIKLSDKQGYKRVCLCLNSKTSNHFYVHRLVAQAFIPNPDNLPVVNHLNFPSNRVEDLEWETQLGNMRKGKKVVDTPNYTLEDREGNQITYDCLKQFSEDYGCVYNTLYAGYTSNGYQIVARGGVAVERKRSSFKEYIIDDLDGNQHTLSNLQEFCRTNRCSAGSLTNGFLSNGFRLVSVDGVSIPPKNRKFKRHLIEDPQGNRFFVENLSEYCKNNGLRQSALHTTYGHKGYKKVG